MCDNYQIQDSLKLKKVSGYCKHSIAREIEGFTMWAENNWEDLKTEMMRMWRKEDSEQMIYTRVYLEEYATRPRDKEDLKDYYRQYDMISKELMLKMSWIHIHKGVYLWPAFL